MKFYFTDFDLAGLEKGRWRKYIKHIEVIGLVKIRKLMLSHNDPDRPDIYGTPDLYLWATSKARKTIKDIAFCRGETANRAS